MKEISALIDLGSARFIGECFGHNFNRPLRLPPRWRCGLARLSRARPVRARLVGQGGAGRRALA